MKKSKEEILIAKIAFLEGAIRDEVGSSTMDLVNQLVECELELEKECNK